MAKRAKKGLIQMKFGKTLGLDEHVEILKKNMGK